MNSALERERERKRQLNLSFGPISVLYLSEKVVNRTNKENDNQSMHIRETAEKEEEEDDEEECEYESKQTVPTHR